MINKFLKMLDIPFDEEEYEKSVIKKSDAIRDCLCKNKNISGAFNELSDKDQQNVVDAFNKMQGVFDGLFGVKMRPYTADDFKSATVKVQTSGSDSECDNCEKTCECENCDARKTNGQKKYDTMKDVLGKHANNIKKNAQKVYKNILEKDETAETGTICDSLLDELQDNSEFETAAKDIAKRVVEVLKNKNNKKYTLTPETAQYAPTAKMTVDFSAVTWTSDKIMNVGKNPENWQEGPLESLVVEEIKKATGVPQVIITYRPMLSIDVILVLKKKS